MSPIIKKILHLTFSSSTIVVANLVLYIIASRNFSLTEYATIRQTFLPYEILIPILTLGIPATIYYLFQRRKDEKKLMIHSFIILYTAISLFVVILLINPDLLSNIFHNEKLSDTTKWLIIYTMFQTPIILLTSFYIYKEKTKNISIISSFLALSLVFFTVLIILTSKDYADVILVKSLIPIFGLIIILYFSRNLFKKIYKKDDLTFKESIINILSISLPFGLASTLSAISMQIDKTIVATLGTTEEFAIYVNGAIEIPIIGIITGSIASILITELSKSIKENDLKKALELFREASSKTALIIFPIMIYFIFNSKEFMVLLYSEKYELSALPFTIYLFLLPIRIVVFSSILIALGKSKLILFRSLIELILNIILSVVMFKLFGYLGIAIATVLITYLWSVPYNIKIIAKELQIRKIDLFDLKLLGQVMLISIIAFPSMFISSFIDTVFIKLILSFAIYLIIIIILFNFYKFINFDFLKKSKGIK